MRIVIQRVSQAEVKVEGKTVGAIEKGLLVLLGIENDDNYSDTEWMVNKLLNLRIFNDKNQVMNCPYCVGILKPSPPWAFGLNHPHWHMVSARFYL